MKVYVQIGFWILFCFNSFSQANQVEYHKGLTPLEKNEYKSTINDFYISLKGFGYDTMNLTYTNNLFQIGQLFFRYNQFDSSSNYFVRGIKISNILSLPIADYILDNCGSSFYRLGKYMDAIKYYRIELDTVSFLYGKSSKESIIPKSNLANSFFKLNILDSALFYYQETLATKEIFYGKKSNEYLLTLSWIIELNIQSVQFQEAKNNLLNYLNIRKEISGINNILYIKNLYKLAFVYEKLSDFKNAEKTYNGLTAINDLNGEIIDSFKSKSLISLTKIYIKNGDFQKAQNSLFEAEKIITGENKVIYKQFLEQNVLYFLEIFDFSKAYQFNQKIIELLSTDSSNFCSLANYYNVNGEIYRRMNQNKEAKSWFLQSIAQKKICGDTVSSSFAVVLNNLALLNINTDSSTYYLTLSYQVFSRIKDEEPDYYAITKLNLALDAFYYRKDTSFAYDLASDILIKYRKYLSAENLRRLFILTTDLNMAIGLDSIAANALRIYMLLKQRQLSELSTFSTNQLNTLFEKDYFEDERQIGHILLQLQIRDSFSVKKYSLLTHYFNLVTIRNSLLLRINFNKKYYINKISQDGALTTFDNLIQKRTLLIDLQRINDNEKHQKELKSQIDSLENILLSQSKFYSEIKSSLELDLNQISSHLKDNSAAIVYFNEDENYYAFIVTKKSNDPKLLFLFRNEQLEDLLYKKPGISDISYINSLYEFNRIGKSIEKLIWEPLDKYLENVSTIYVVTSGHLNTINLSFIPLNARHRLADKYSLKFIGSAGDIITLKNQYISDSLVQKAWLFGGIDYNKISLEFPVKTVNKRKVIDTLSGKTRSGERKWGYLMHTFYELISIDSLCRLNNIPTEFYSAEYASKTAFKQISGEPNPFLLHIASHGFLIGDSVNYMQTKVDNIYISNRDSFKKSQNPLVRSGLVFAGANKVSRNSSLNSINSDDGILTALEISNLNLSNSKLVVLSSCQSGLGIHIGSEGIFGLQRAFKLAGTQNIIMSLWSIPDSQTKELMKIFYAKLFSGSSVYDSLKFAQIEMSKSYPPYFWAAFKLLE